MLKKTLKKISFIAAATMIITACSSSKKATGTPGRNDVKGNWLLENITYDGLPQGQKIKLVLLDEGDENCLIGSTWVFPNNGNGSYTITQNKSGCTPGERNIVWKMIKRFSNTKGFPGELRPRMSLMAINLILCRQQMQPCLFVQMYPMKGIPSQLTTPLPGNSTIYLHDNKGMAVPRDSQSLI